MEQVHSFPALNVEQTQSQKLIPCKVLLNFQKPIDKKRLLTHFLYIENGFRLRYTAIF